MPERPPESEQPLARPIDEQRPAMSVDAEQEEATRVEVEESQEAPEVDKPRLINIGNPARRRGSKKRMARSGGP